ncbi:ABC transporter related protein [Thermodesulfatator indicus DSM 15286]|uniref:ABC transporter related protein n=1 Tax=Thermodesulfatator indicus (strain DSM 15286 / JCM 11887 / CIR29812) TaxID=667014 RepID=F8ACB8_THEID|nr:ABC transporter ATP-binding protein [Thermodesulfatator indicus]AEH45756.1 ABC transporter related protein [Thermodesulfatator indicus DSM 15286]
MSLISLKKFRVKKGSFYLKIDDLYLSSGELVAICGRNGSGKTTFIKALTGLIPYKGSYLLNSQEFKKIPDKEKYRVISYLPQEGRLGLPFDVFYVVLSGRFPITDGKKYRPKDFVATEKILEKLELTSFKARPFQQLSGGEKRRVLLVRALNREAKLLFLDEPFSGVDLLHQQKILQFLRFYVQELNALVLVVVHELSLALRHFDRLLFLENGMLMGDLTPEEVTESFLSRLIGLPTKLLRPKDPNFDGIYLVGR